MITAHEAQQNVRRSGQLWATSRGNCVACISVSAYEGYIKASAEPDRLTEKQVSAALARVYPGWKIRIWQEDGLIYAEATRQAGE